MPPRAPGNHARAITLHDQCAGRGDFVHSSTLPVIAAEKGPPANFGRQARRLPPRRIWDIRWPAVAARTAVPAEFRRLIAYAAEQPFSRFRDGEPCLRRTGIVNRCGVIGVATKDAYGLSPVPFGALASDVLNHFLVVHRPAER